MDKYTPFAQRVEYNDLEPIPQDDGPFPVCPIAYSPQFIDTMNYFRAVLQKDERSERALKITEEVIELNAANYTAWYFRRLILQALNKNLENELSYVEELAKDNPKNYQIWYHRRWLVEQLKDPSKEIQFTAEILAEDAKNYHAWSHRQWILKEFKLWNKELDYVNELLTTDVRNNSAWNHRYFLFRHTLGYSAVVKGTEIMYTIEKIKKAPSNESAWNYLTGLMKGDLYADFPAIETFCKEHEHSWILCPHLFSTLVDICEQAGGAENIEKAKKYCDELVKIDEIHSKLWIWRKKQLPQ